MQGRGAHAPPPAGGAEVSTPTEDAAPGGWSDAAAPTLADFDALARAAFATLPAQFRERCPDLAILVEDFPDEEVMADLGVEDPFELTGLYDGVDIGAKNASAVALGPDRILLYRRPILDEWAERGNVTLGELVTHILIHEIAHHFGFEDDDIAAIDDWTA
jgi:predicted Zn-dependent protease with MMP-like domain